MLQKFCQLQENINKNLNSIVMKPQSSEQKKLTEVLRESDIDRIANGALKK